MRLIAVLVGLCLLSCGGINHADFSKRKYLDLRKFSDRKERDNAIRNLITEDDDSFITIDTAQNSILEKTGETFVFIEEKIETEKMNQIVEETIDQSIIEFPDTNKTDASTEEVAEDPDVVSNNPDLETFNQRAKFSFWLILGGFAAAIFSVAVILAGPGWLYAIVVVIAAICLLTGFGLSIKNASMAKKIPAEDRTGLFNLKLWFAWVVSVIGIFILAALAAFGIISLL